MAHHDRPDIKITRVFDAPREVIWKYWTDAEYMKRWMAPKGFTAPSIEIDFREGGKYHNAMQAPDGQKFWSTGTYEEIVPLEKIVITDSFADEKGNVVPATYYGMDVDFPLKARITVLLEELEGKTKVTLRHSGLPEGEMKKMTEAGWNESFDKIDSDIKLLAKKR